MSKTRIPITKKKDKRHQAYKAGKEVGYFEAMRDVYNRNGDKDAFQYVIDNIHTARELVKKYYDNKYVD